MAFEAILVGDLHLDKMRKLFGDRCNELVIDELDKACAYAYENAIPEVIQLGDVCERSRMSYDAHLRLIKLCHKWDGKITIRFMLGNHDFDEYGVHSLQLVELMYNLGMFKTIHVYAKSAQENIGGVWCNFLAWPDIKPMKAEKQPLNFGHFETAGSTGDNGRVLKHGVEVPDKHLFFNGHLHTPHQSGNVHYVGTLFQTSFGERLPKSMTHLKARYDDSGKNLKITQKRIEVEPAFQLHNVVVTTKKDLKQVLDTPTWLYRLLIGDGVEIPDTWMEEHPNVVKYEGYTTKAELEALSAEEWLPQDQDGAPILDEADELRTMLLSKYKLPEERADRALTMLSGLLSRANPELAE